MGLDGFAIPVQFGTANRLKLGLFGANILSGTAFIAIPERWQADWAENVAVTHMADAAAKQFVTADHIGGGRFALHVVVGWNEDEFDMFDIRPPPETRCPYAREWLATIRRLWTEAREFDVQGCTRPTQSWSC